MGRTTVAYILGWGRSGSTLLDTLLGGVDGIFSAGELRFLWQRGLIDGRKCGCGRLVAECPVWLGVLDRTFPGGRPDIAELLDLQSRCARFRYVLGLARSSPGRLPEHVQRYTDLLGRLYGSIASETGASVVVDSSKWPTDVALLRLTAGVDIAVVHLVRDPRAVAYSWQRTKEQPDRATPSHMHQVGPFASSTRWLAWNAAAELLRTRLPAERWLTVRYETFVSKPRTTVSEICRMLGRPGEVELPFRGERQALLPANHTVAGNPSRFRTGAIELRADDEWKRDQPRLQAMLSSAPALPLLSRYGYPLLPPGR